MKKHYFLLFILVIVLNFFIPRMMPGDPLTIFMLNSSETGTTLSQEQLLLYKKYFGIEGGMLNQFLTYLLGILKLDFGYSFYYKTKVLNLVLSKISWTLFIVLTSLLISVCLGSLLASISILHNNSKKEKIFYSLMVIISEIPSFLIGTLLIIIFCAKLNLFPLFGGMSTFSNYSSSFELLIDIIYHATLPILTLAIAGISEFYLLARSSMITIISKSYIKTAKAKALPSKRVFLRYFLQNSFYPILSQFAVKTGKMFGGAILVENIFSYPGIGSLIKNAVILRDYPLIQGIFLIISIIILFLSYFVEILNKKFDPRVM